MKSKLFLLAALLAGCADSPIAPDQSSFDFLAGCWELAHPNGAYQEMWLPSAADGSIGVGREVRNGKTVSWEFQRIEIRPDGSIAFVAKPSGQPGDEFRLTEHAPGHLVFENPQHDFPTRIEYQYVDLNTLHASVSGPGR